MNIKCSSSSSSSSSIPSHEDQETNNNDNCFNTSLSELRALSSQLLHAADQCETAFLKSKHKKKLLEHTQSYLCQAVVTVIDHIGTVSFNLEQTLYDTIEVSETELRIDSLNHRLFSCQQFAVSLSLTSFRLSAEFLRHYPKYTSKYVKNCSIHHNRDRLAVAGSFLNDTKMKAKERLGKTETRLPAIPFTEHSPRLSKPFNALYGTQAMEAFKMGLCDHKKESVQKSPFLSVLRRNIQKKMKNSVAKDDVLIL
ncbi:uncharacterized protein LOC120251547 [Dioscorea cayenensis subsp. rotundata]|uniref:Uncharacterized protein LOC120251547 n=1 Tax=Dioscorea cayennensis subsp. rotundata TaxID=55577 RepID=A0AB40AM60_DIOCR|nr:uncharacterized protein LOC120251547 [Dioscorea cayenensis subsp. rotundata]XP_039116037.1 uncharacterized protein LOC120251547 [Dioscorea cayenensis subsp. rotundata]